MSDEDDHPPRGRGVGRRGVADEYDGDMQAAYRRRRLGVAGWILVGSLFALLGAAGAAGVVLYLHWGGQGTVVQAGARLPAATQPPAAVAATDPISRQAQQWNISTCVPAIGGLARYLTANTNSSWRLLHGLTDADKQLFAGTIVGQDKATGLAGVSTLFAAPVAAGGCDTGYVLAIYFPETCDNTRTRKEAGFEARLDLGTAAEVYSNASGRGTISLLPAGAAGCVMIRSEVAY